MARLTHDGDGSAATGQDSFTHPQLRWRLWPPITYDIDTDTLWVLDSRTPAEDGLGVVRNYTLDGTLLSSFVVKGASVPQPFGLAYDAKDNSLWISRVVGFDSPIVLEKYSTSGTYLRRVTTKLIGQPGGMEFRVRRWS